VRNARVSYLSGLVFFLAGCATVPPKLPPPAPLVTRYTALTRLDPPNVPAFEDDLDIASLRTAATQSLSYYQSLPKDPLFVLGSDTYTVTDLIDSMSSLIHLLDSHPERSEWLPVLRDTFTVYQSVGVDPDKTVVFSSYYEPSLSARLTKDAVYRYPLYARPPDLVDVDLSLFDPIYVGARIAGRREGQALVPYPTRADIDSRKILKDQGLEIAWAKDPMDVLDLQIEGSGWLDLGTEGLRRVRYDGNNGRRYRSVGQYVIATGRIPAKKFSRHAFLRYMETHPKERQTLLNINERYIFFRIDLSTASSFAYGNINVPLTPGRSIATDPKLFPKGALAWIDTTKAVVDAKDRVKGATPLKRFMVNQDEGGAIQGPGRVDIFSGEGKDAKLFATHLWNKGKLYFLVKKKS
jgi:membrane-bound lytic murein transglycosylase A